MRQVRLTGLLLIVWIMASITVWAADAQEKIPDQTKDRAGQGDAEGQYKLGESYYYGDGVAKDYAEAAKWFRKAAEQGHIRAQVNLGACYGTGQGVEKDNGEAVKWLRRAAEQGHVIAQYNLGVAYVLESDYAEAAKWYRKAAEEGHTDAQFQVAQMYHNGQGMEKDPVEAVKWLRRAAEQGEGMAQHNLGLMYTQGIGVEKDDGEAVKWYRKAAEQGKSLAQSNLGLMYANGRGVERDNAEAVKWYRKAAEQGHGGAQVNLGVCYQEGRGVEKDYAEAVKWYRKAAEQGETMGQYNLAALHVKGEGLEKDYVEGYAWLNLAATKDENSRETRDKLEKQMTAQQVAEGQNRTRELRAMLERKSKVSLPEGGYAMADGEDSDQPKQSGTGFLITKDGYLVTNQHVVRDASAVRVLTAQGLKDATVVRADPWTDLALLKIEGTWKALAIATSRGVRRGQTVGTVGFPNIGLQGFEPKACRGEIASLTGVMDDPQNFQIGVPVQPGNSGGALFDLKGNVVGVVRGKLAVLPALASSGAIPENVNYAIKSSYLLSLLESVPQVGEGLVQPGTKEGSFEDAVKVVEAATVLVLAY